MAVGCAAACCFLPTPKLSAGSFTCGAERETLALVAAGLGAYFGMVLRFSRPPLDFPLAGAAGAVLLLPALPALKRLPRIICVSPRAVVEWRCIKQKAEVRVRVEGRALRFDLFSVLKPFRRGWDF